MIKCCILFQVPPSPTPKGPQCLLPLHLNNVPANDIVQIASLNMPAIKEVDSGSLRNDPKSLIFSGLQLPDPVCDQKRSYIFFSNRHTHEECIQRMLLGTSDPPGIKYLEINRSLLFLFNTTEQVRMCWCLRERERERVCVCVC